MQARVTKTFLAATASQRQGPWGFAGPVMCGPACYTPREARRLRHRHAYSCVPTSHRDRPAWHLRSASSHRVSQAVANRLKLTTGRAGSAFATSVSCASETAT
ncbi:MAG: hypothetical protein IID58_06930 [Proteobacteria bacterium]|nr:hypothetical protein [Pseudomonadota bacterium]